MDERDALFEAVANRPVSSRVTRAVESSEWETGTRIWVDAPPHSCGGGWTSARCDACGDCAAIQDCAICISYAETEHFLRRECRGRLYFRPQTPEVFACAKCGGVAYDRDWPFCAACDYHAATCGTCLLCDGPREICDDSTRHRPLLPSRMRRA